MTNDTTKEWVEAYFLATQSGDAQVWFETFAKEATVEDPVGTPVKTTADEIMAQGTAFLSAFATVGLFPEFIHTNGLEATAMWTGRATTLEGEKLSFSGIDLFEFDESGKITLLRGFWTPPGD